MTAIVAGALALAMVAAVFGGIAGGLLVSRRDGVPSPLPVPAAGSTSRPAGSIADIAARSLPSVVTIKVEGADAAGTGSGFVLRQDGYILTNNHVVEAAGASGKITVIFSDGKSNVAKVIGRDASYDLAVVRVDRSGLPVLPLGASSAVVVGDPVIAVGAPLGLDSTVTSGIVSALNRPVTPGGAADSTTSFINAIQTDAAINPGNSGGPLLDMAGRVIGVNSAIARIPGSESQVGGQSGSIGVGFAIPSDQARKTADQLMATGKVGGEVSPEDATACARQCALNAIAAVKAQIGDLDQVKRVVKVVCFVASTPDFTGQPQVANGASELLGTAFGDAGVHARSAVGVAVLPLDAPVEVEILVEV
jgi:putative serine protease PepD